ncbi:ROK family protein [Horticoccus sp. 23ND18S-11]|uniref:ROK family protein n=1 Tax=Horticoccus sp. 23ND18S-11 TaxID=3391832 RepID=UPI0039C988DE
MIWAAGIDIGGTQVKAVAVTDAGEVRQRAMRATRDGEAGAAEWIAGARGLLADFSSAEGNAPAAIGVGAPGLVASDARSIAHLPGKLAGLVGLDWTAALDRTTIVPVLNDAQAALLGEAWIGAARDRRHVVMVTLGTGVGGAVLNDGRLLRGAIGRAGHLGHMSLDPSGPASITGMPGAIEVWMGDCTVAARTGGRFSTTAELVAAHRAGDAAASAIWLRSVRALACAIGSWINLFDPEVVVIGGGIALAGDALFVPLARELDAIEWRPGGHRVPIVAAALGEWAGAIGAARHALTFHDSH